MKSLFEQMGGTYREENGYLIPNLTVSDKHYNIGKYGMLRRTFLKEYHKATYTVMLMNGTILEHLAEIDKMCNEEMDRLVSKMVKNEGVTEALKTSDQMEWVRRMNNIRARAEEIIYSDIVYGGFEI